MKNGILCGFSVDNTNAIVYDLNTDVFEVQPLSSVSLRNQEDATVFESMMVKLDQLYNTFDYQPVRLENQHLYVEDPFEDKEQEW